MKTVNHILRVELDRAPADAKPRGLPKVVDLEAWKAEHLAEPVEPEAERVNVPVRRRKSPAALDWAELTATLAVAAAFLALAARVLLF